MTDYRVREAQNRARRLADAVNAFPASASRSTEVQRMRLQAALRLNFADLPFSQRYLVSGLLLEVSDELAKAATAAADDSWWSA